MNLHNFGHSLSGVGQWIVSGGVVGYLTIEPLPKWAMLVVSGLGLLLYTVGKGILIYTGEPGTTDCQIPATPVEKSPTEPETRTPPSPPSP